ncbi:MAG: hypothetical protein IKC24_04215 [Oscillospiraceae bacterium]|nr:hypothetical protein [Oscillospiraceae bacterium]
MKKKRKQIKLTILQLYVTLSIIMEKIRGTFYSIEPVRKDAKRRTEENEPEDEKELIRYLPKDKKAKKISGRDACLAFCNFPTLTEYEQTASMILLLVLLSQIAPLLLSVVPCLPVLCLSSANTQTTALLLGTLLHAIQGQEHWEGYDWKLKRPWVIKARLSLGETRPSPSIIDYIGGSFHGDCGEEQEFCYPYIGCSMVLMPGLPDAVARYVVEISPMSMPITFGKWKKNDSRPLLELKEGPLDIYDPKGLDRFEKYAGCIYLQIITFLKWFCRPQKGKKHRQQWQKGIDKYRPVAHKGRFIQYKTDEKTDYLCAALSLFEQYLYFASEKSESITAEEAQEILLRYWRLVLPESAPASEENTVQFSPSATFDDPDVFYKFLLTHFIPTYRNQIFTSERGGRGTMGLIRVIDDTEYLITPRRSFLEQYRTWLTGQNAEFFELSNSRSETSVQGALQNAGVPLRGEKNNPRTWRYQFYSNTRAMVNCFGLPIRQLPNELQEHIGTLFGQPKSDIAVPNKSEALPNAGKAVKT